MGKSEVESPLLVDRHHDESEVCVSVPRVGEEYVAVPESEVGSATHGKHVKVNWTALLTASICGIATILFVSGAAVSYKLSIRETPAGEGHGLLTVGDDEYDFCNASKTAFHFQPEQNWMNDPNGPLYHGGYYHFFYQYNPDGATFGNISWGHAVSLDLIHWEYLEVILYPDQWYDAEGVWSGSATVLRDGSPVIIYTGGRLAEDGVSIIQSQALALPVDPNDPLLRKWVKGANNPIMEPPPGYKSEDFRDPTTAWLEDDGYWRLLIGTKLDKEDGSVGDGMSLLYKSMDFEHWELAENYLHEVDGTGMWECVDFYPVYYKEAHPEPKEPSDFLPGPENYLDSYRYVLKASLDTWTQDWYTIGTYSTETHKFTLDEPDLDIGTGYRYDYGKFYASKSFHDTSTGRRIVWGWVNESDSTRDDLLKGWASVQAIPRTVWLDDKTQTNLLTWPVEEVDSLRGAQSSYRDIDLKYGDVIKVEGGDGPQLDILISFEKPNIPAAGNVRREHFDCSQGGSAQEGIFGPFGVLVLSDDDLIEQTAIFFYITAEELGTWSTRVCSDQSRSSLAKNLDISVYGSYVTTLPVEDELTLRILVDHSIVETFVQGGRMAITSRVYPTVALSENAHMYLFNNGTTTIRMKSLDVYQMTDVDMINP